MKVVHISLSPLTATHAQHLSSALRDVAEEGSILVTTKKYDGVKSDFTFDSHLVPREIRSSELVHLHHCLPNNLPDLIRRAVNKKPIVYTYYKPGLPKPPSGRNLPSIWTCLANESLIDYENAIPVPELIPLRESRYVDSCPVHAEDETFTVGWSTDIADSAGIKRALDTLIKTPQVRVAVVSKDNISATSLVLRKKCLVAVDDLSVGGYTRSALEYLAVGVPVICAMHDKVSYWLQSWGQGDKPPIIKAEAGQVLPIIDFLRENRGYIRNISYRSRDWMLKYWNEQKVVEAYERVYNSLLCAVATEDD